MQKGAAWWKLGADSAFNLKHSGKCKTLSQNITVRVP